MRNSEPDWSNPNPQASEWACREALWCLQGLAPKGSKIWRVSEDVQQACLCIELRSARFLVYAYVTEDPDFEKTHSQKAELECERSVPLSMLDLALELNAEPLAVEFNVARKGPWHYYNGAGFDAVRERISKGQAWVEHILRGRDVSHYLRKWRQTIDQPEFIIGIRHWRFVERKGVHLEFADPELRSCDQDVCVSIHQLLKSTFETQEDHLFTCATCGFAECARIHKKVLVIHQRGYTLLKFRSLPGRPLRVYRTADYRKAVIEAVRQLLAQFRAAKCELILPPYEERAVDRINQDLFEAENFL
jgi:hypothetical protein